MLEKAVYRIKTQLGVSKESYSHSDTSPVFGTGQGSCSSPPIWLLGCSRYFDIYDSQCYGSNYCDQSRTLNLRFGMVGFVDDNRVQVNCHPRDRSSLMQKATHDGQLWSDILWSSGGILEHDKCSYHYLRTDFDRNGAPVLRGGLHGGPITIRDHANIPTDLEQLSNYTSYKTLGTYQSPGSQQKAQYNVLMEKSKLLTRTLATSCCGPAASYQFFASVYGKSIGYPLAVSRLSDKQLSKIQGPMIPLILNRMVFPRTYPHAVAFGPRHYGGLELNHLITNKHADSLSLLLRHLRTPGQGFTMARIIINRLQYNAGVSYSILEFPERTLRHLEGTWMPHIRRILSNIHGSILFSGLVIEPLQRVHDQYIMEYAMTLPGFSSADISSILYCRYYLCALTVSDLCDARGISWAPGIFSGVQTHLQSASLLIEPFQERPPDKAWAVWRRLLRTLADSAGFLSKPMGPWLLPTTKLRRRWPFLYSRSHNLLYRWCIDSYEILEPRSNVFCFSPCDTTLTFPVDAIPVDVSLQSTGWKTFPAGNILSLPHVSLPFAATFDEYLDTIPPYERCLVLRYDLHHRDLHSICDQLHDFSQLIMVSDGGTQYNYGSYGWCIGLLDGTRLARGSGTAFGLDPKSYRAECYGAKAVLLFVTHAFRYCQRPLPPGLAQFHCDNEGLVKKLLKFQSFRLAVTSACMDSEWDVLTTIHTLLQQFPSIPSVRHVLGHQDRTTAYNDLSLAAQMNVDADHCATLEMLEFGTVQPLVPFDPTSCVSLSLSGRTVTRGLSRSIINALFLPNLQKYLCNRFLWSNATFSSIDWDSYSMVYSKYPRSRTFFHKFGVKKLAVGERLHRRESRFDERCPLCLNEPETDDHILQCSHPSRLQWRRSFIKGIVDHLTPFLDPDLLDMICLGLRGYFNQDPTLLLSRFPLPATPSEDFDLATPPLFTGRPGLDSYFDSNTLLQDQYTALCHAQSAIGWDHFLRGKWSRDWLRIQYRHSMRYNYLAQSKNWNIWLIRYMANNTHALWLKRNTQRHGHDSATRNDAQLDQAKCDVGAIYQLRSQILPEDDDLFGASLALHQTEPLASLTSWLMMNKPLILASVRTAKQQAKAGAQSLTDFFEPTPRKLGPRRPRRKHRRPPSYYLTRLTRYYRASPGSHSRLPTIPETHAVTRPAGVGYANTGFGCAKTRVGCADTDFDCAKARRLPSQRFLSDFFPVLPPPPSRKDVNIYPDRPG